MNALTNDLALAIDPDMINRLVVESVLRSSLGEYVKQECERQIKDVASGYDAMVKRAVREVISQVLIEVVRDEYSDHIRAALRAKLSDDVLEQLIEQLYKAHWQYITRP